jgi:hypothetical protein|tara:strand:- start:36 stop:881 length:846 start_codon:yes stop_codon:yes gene_type:complete
MGNFPTNDGFISRGLAYVPTNTIDARPAWLFENQTGTLGTNLTGSSVYVGVTGTVRGIITGTEGVQATVASLGSIVTPGSGYFAANGLTTTVTSIVPSSAGTGCTVDITVPVPTSTLVAGQAGLAYTVGNLFTSVPAPVGGTGLIGAIASISGGAATGPAASLTITKGGSGYSVNDVITITSAGSNNLAKFTITGALNGAVTDVVVNAVGQQYAVGDVLTVDQGGSGGNCTVTVSAVKSLLPVAGDAVDFLNAQAGSILPVVFDYILIPAAAPATNLIVGK